MRKKGQEGGFRVKEEVVEAQKTGMGTICHIARSCQAKNAEARDQGCSTVAPCYVTRSCHFDAQCDQIVELRLQLGNREFLL